MSTKSYFVLIIFIFALNHAVCAQSTAFRRGDLIINAAPGFTTLGPEFSVGLETALDYKNTIGVKTGFIYHQDSYVSENYEYGIAYMGLSYNYHFAHLLARDRRMDYYAGIAAGYSYWSPFFQESETTGTDYFVEDSRAFANVEAGMHFFFRRKYGLWIELTAGTWISAHAGFSFII